MKNATVDLFFQIPYKTQVVYLPLLRSKNQLFEEVNAKRLQHLREEEGSDIYEVVIKRNKSGSLVDFEFSLNVQPIYFYWRSLLINVIKSFTSLGTKSSEELKLNAWDKFQEVKDKSQEKIQSALLKTTNILNCSIEDPKLILPFTQNNDVDNPAYMLCLGSLKIKANKDNLDEPLYQYLQVSIEGTQLQYFESLLLCRSYERDNLRISLASDEIKNTLNKNIFNVIEELEMHFKVGQKKSGLTLSSKDAEKAQFVIDGQVSGIKINMTAERYNSLINFNKIIETSSQNLASKIILHEKEDIIKMATKTGYLRRRGDTLQYWNKQYAVLSGSYLYFYPEEFEKSESYETWFYIKDAIVETEGEEGENVFFIANNTKYVFLYVQEEEEMKEWIKVLRERVFEIGSLAGDYNKPPTDVNTAPSIETGVISETKVFDVNLNFEKFEYNMINDNYKKFLTFKISKMSLNAGTIAHGNISSASGKFKNHDNKYSTSIAIEIKKVKVNDVLNKLLILESINGVSFTVDILNKNSPNYKGANVVLEFHIDIVKVNFMPETIKRMILFFKRVDFEGAQMTTVFSPKKEKPIYMDIEESKMITSYLKKSKIKRNGTFSIIEESKGDDSGSEDQEKLNSLATQSILKVFLNFNKARVVTINPFNMKPFFYLEAEKVFLSYELKQTYHLLALTCDDMQLKVHSCIFGIFDVIQVKQSQEDSLLRNIQCPLRLN